MKKTIVFFCCLLCCLFCIPAKTITNFQKRISAYKYETSFGGSTPSDPIIRIINPYDQEISTGDDIVLAGSVIGSEKLAFSWVFSGNSIVPVTLSFTFTPLMKVGGATVESIPYAIRIEHEKTRVANSVLPASGIMHTVNGTAYYFSYAEAGTGPTISPSRLQFGQNVDGSQSLDIRYNIRYSVSPAPYPDTLNVIDQWSRYGNAYVTLDITDQMTFSPGLYRVNVTVGFTTT